MPRDLFPELDTPALLIDVGVLEANLDRMAAALEGGPTRIRSHFKAHRMAEISKRQIARGAIGITCAKLGEAEALADEGLDHFLIANEVVGPHKWRRLAALAERVEVIVGVDDLEVAEATAAAAREAGTTVNVVVDVDSGLHRCGVPPGPAVSELARRCAELRGLRFRGVMGYEGHVVMLPRAEKKAMAAESLGVLVEAAEQIRADGLPVEIVSAGGTGCWDITARFPGVTEIQAGTYAMMDILFHDDAGAKDFDYACTVLGTVVSRQGDEHGVTDCGKKALHASFGMARVLDQPGAELLALHSEHGVLRLSGESQSLRVGDRLRFLPYYGEGTINLYDRAYAVRGPEVLAEWPITGRGRSQ